MGEVTDLFDYHGTCLGCGTRWKCTEAQLAVAATSKILYSPCCQMPATIVRSKAKKTGSDKCPTCEGGKNVVEDYLGCPTCDGTGVIVR